MKIPTWIELPPVEVDVEVSVEDIANALNENPDSAKAAFFAKQLERFWPICAKPNESLEVES